MSQTPIVAPSVRQLKQTRIIESSQNALFNSSFCKNAKDNVYLFENMDGSLLKTNDEYINKINNKTITLQFKLYLQFPYYLSQGARQVLFK